METMRKSLFYRNIININCTWGCQSQCKCGRIQEALNQNNFHGQHHALRLCMNDIVCECVCMYRTRLTPKEIQKKTIRIMYAKLYEYYRPMCITLQSLNYEMSTLTKDHITGYINI